MKLYQTDSDIKLFDEGGVGADEVIMSPPEKLTPPDIVVEHPKIRDQEEHQPDLIKHLNQVNEIIDDANCSIVGDFGREIAEELDTGYNFKLYKNVSSTVLSSSSMRKVEDAKLSSAIDKIAEVKAGSGKMKVIENPEVIENNNKTG